MRVLLVRVQPDLVVARPAVERVDHVVVGQRVEDVVPLVQHRGHGDAVDDQLISKLDKKNNKVDRYVRAGGASVDPKTGKVKWEREAFKATPFGGRHRKNTYASATPVTDGERVFAYYGNVGVFAFTVNGDPLWSWRMDPSLIYLDFGDGASPALHEDLLFINNDNEEDCYTVALDKREVRLGSRPVHAYTLSNEVEYIKPKARVY